MSEDQGWMWRAVRLGASAITRYITEAVEAGERVLVPVSLTLRRPGAPPPPDDVTVALARTAVDGLVRQHLEILGVPAVPDVVITVETTTRAGSDDYVLRVNGHRLRCARGDVADIVAEATHGERVTLPDAPWAQIPRIATDLVGAALRRRLSVLLSDSGCARLLDTVRVHWERRPEVADALRAVVDHAVSVAETITVTEVVDTTSPCVVTVTERLIDRLRPKTLDILFSPATLRAVTLAQPDEQTLFTGVRERVYADLGILAPDFSLRVDDTVPDGRVAFGLNAVRTRTWAVAEDRPLTGVCHRLEFLIRRHPAWFISMSTIEEIMSPLRLALPDTVRGAADRCPPEWQSALARALLDEGMSVRHVPTLLDRLIDLDPEPRPPGVVRLREGPTPVERLGTVERLPRPGRAVPLLRQRQLEGALRMRDGDPTIARRDLDPALEDELAHLIADEDGDHEEVLERVTAAVHRWMDDDPGVPLVVRSPDLRDRLLDELKAEFPDLVIYAVQELPPGTLASVTAHHPDDRRATTDGEERILDR